MTRQPNFTLKQLEKEEEEQQQQQNSKVIRNKEFIKIRAVFMLLVLFPLCNEKEMKKKKNNSKD